MTGRLATLRSCLPTLLPALALASACAGEADVATVADAAGDVAPAPDLGADVAGPADLPELPEEVDAGPEWAPPPGPGFHRDGDQIVDAQGRVVVLHGVNTSNSAKSAPDHYPWHGPADLADLAAAGFDSVRWVMSWAAVMPEEGVVDDAWLDGLTERVGWAREAGLLVVLDMHQDVFGYGFGHNGAPAWACDAAHYTAYEPQTPWWMNYTSPEVMACFDHFYGDDATFAHFVDAWVAVAETAGADPAVLGFDLLNEPHWGSHDLDRFVQDVWQPRQEQLAAALHAVAPDRIVFFEGPPVHALGFTLTFDEAADPEVAFAPHYYHPEVHEGAAFEPAMVPDMLDALDAIEATAASLGGALGPPPVWMGEFGAHPSLPSAPAYVEVLVSAMAARRWGWAWWSDDLGGGFSLRSSDGTFQPGVLEPLTHPYAQRIPGPLLEQSMDFEAGRYEARFTWTRDADLWLWIGSPPADVTLTAAGEAVPCAPRSDRPAGLWACPPAPERSGLEHVLVMMMSAAGSTAP